MPIREGIEISHEDAAEFDRLMIEATYYDKMQYVYKIKLNSFYGALTNKYFRFYDLRMGESTTGTGRMILQHQCAKVNEILTGDYNPSGEAIIYGDTDSSYFSTFAENEEEAVMIADRVGDLVSESFNKFVENAFLVNLEYNDIVKCGREIVSDRGIFVDKKRYILHLVDNEGDKVDKMKIMGLELKKTTLPKEVSTKLSSFVERLLKGESWDDVAKSIVDYRKELGNSIKTDPLKIGLPKGVKGVEEYTRELKLNPDTVRLPGHVAASILYNSCRDQFNDKESMPIVSGMKIKVFYLKNKVDRFKSIALPTDTETIPEWFIEQFVPIIDIEAQLERLVDKPLQHIFKAIGRETPSEQTLIVDSLLDF